MKKDATIRPRPIHSAMNINDYGAWRCRRRKYLRSPR